MCIYTCVLHIHIYKHIYIYIYVYNMTALPQAVTMSEGRCSSPNPYGGTSYQDPANQDPLSQNSENTALRNQTVR